MNCPSWRQFPYREKSDFSSQTAGSCPTSNSTPGATGTLVEGLSVGMSESRANSCDLESQSQECSGWHQALRVFLFLFLFFAYHETCKILVLYPGMEPRTPAVEAKSLNHWTTREIPTEGFGSSKMTDCLTLQGRMNFQLWPHGTARSNGREPTDMISDLLSHIPGTGYGSWYVF